MNWVEMFRRFVTRNLKVFAYANNHYGYGAIPRPYHPEILFGIVFDPHRLTKTL